MRRAARHVHHAPTFGALDFIISAKRLWHRAPPNEVIVPTNSNLSLRPDVSRNFSLDRLKKKPRRDDRGLPVLPEAQT